jgi:hypothetical protein
MFPLRALVAPIVQSPDFAPMLLELALEQIVVGRLSSEAVPVLGQHHRDTAGSHHVPHPIRSRAPKARATLAGVRDLLKDLVALAGRVLP